MSDYNFSAIEKKWQKRWLENKTFKTDGRSPKPKFYCLDMFPYPSGAGLHVGHPEGYTATDILCRYKRMKGFNVLHPMGWDAFGLPAEQYAVETGTHPAVTTKKNVDRFREQIRALGFSYDWDREINTTDPKYYKWTQWIFGQLYRKGLAYVAEVPVNWCPALGTVLANEEVIDGRSERGNHPVIRKPMRQWMLRITEYAERLLKDLDTLDWPDGIKEMQRNWIGKSEGALVDFKVGGDTVTVYTTRCDTLFGATYMVLSPEHKLVAKWLDEGAIGNAEAVKAYQKKAASKSDLERTELNKEKTGVKLEGLAARNPVNGADLPVFISDYVLATYGTGAIMAVPAHDERDFDFARVFGLPIVQVVAPADSAEAKNASKDPVPYAADAAFTDIATGVMVSSGFLTGLSVDEARKTMVKWLEEHKVGQAKTQYKLRDWLFSRQRYWGEPFPVIHWEDGTQTLVDEGDLPLTLPALEDYKPTGTGEPPLAKAIDWVHVVDPKTGRKGVRETNTMPQWAGSCWYYLRYIDPTNDRQFADPELLKRWLPVDLYVGGAEHAVLHLLYARFWHKVLFDLGLVPTAEPFQRLVNQGMILGLAYKTKRGVLVPMDQIAWKDGKPFGREEGGELEELTEFPAKMSKSLKNVVNPDDVIRDFGADSLRLYEMFMGPLQAVKPWSTKGVEGVHRFLKRANRFVTEATLEDRAMNKAEAKAVAAMVKKVGDDLEAMSFNTAISAMMVFINEAEDLLKRQGGRIARAAAERFVQCLAPFAPHLGEELWEFLGHADTIAYEPWPTYDAAALVEDEIEVPVQVLGKLRGRIRVPVAATPDEMTAAAKQNADVAKFLEGKTIVKVIAVPKRMVNFVVRSAAALLFASFAALSASAAQVSLNGPWELKAFPQPDDGAVRSLPLPAGVTAKTYAATVPGCCELELMRSGELPEPLTGFNAFRYRDYEGHQWLYSRRFTAPGRSPGERAVLVFEGVDTLADYFLNGEKIGESDNMLIAHEFDVTGKVREGAENEIAVLIRPVGLEAREATLGELGHSMGGGADHEYYRKAPHMYGWDILPHLPVSGIWRDVRFEMRPAVRIDQPAWIVKKLDCARKWAEMLVFCRIHAPFRHYNKATVRCTLSLGGRVCAQDERIFRGAQFKALFPLRDARLWWPRGAGDQPLYTAKIEVVGENGQTLAENACRIGIRTVALEYDDRKLPERPGRFLFRVNGEPIYVRGVDWVPLDPIPSEQRRHLKAVLPLMADLNANLVRVWGGGVYEPDEFFDWCDENGVMVWQDFMTACAVPPQDDDFAARFRRETLAVVLRLRNRASLALWAGDNENDLASTWTLGKLARDPNTYRITREVIPNVLKEFDITRSYLPSSPYVSKEAFRGEAEPCEDHLWGGARAWWKTPYYTNNACWFCSEGGAHAVPARSSLERMMGKPAAERPWKNPDTPNWQDLEWTDEWRYRSTCSRLDPKTDPWKRNNIVLKQCAALFGDVPRHDLDLLIEQSQSAQAESIKFQVELFRSQKFVKKGGFVVWNLRDGWPTLSDAFTDYYGAKKKAYEALKAAYRDVLVMVTEDRRLLAVNDTLRPVKGEVKVVEAKDGRTVHEGGFAVAANGLAEVAKLSWQGQGLFRIEYTVGGVTFRTHYLHGEPPFGWNDYREWTK